MLIVVYLWLKPLILSERIEETGSCILLHYKHCRIITAHIKLCVINLFYPVFHYVLLCTYEVTVAVMFLCH